MNKQTNKENMTLPEERVKNVSFFSLKTSKSIHILSGWVLLAFLCEKTNTRTEIIEMASPKRFFLHL